MFPEMLKGREKDSGAADTTSRTEETDVAVKRRARRECRAEGQERKLKDWRRFFKTEMCEDLEATGEPRARREEAT